MKCFLAQFLGDNLPDATLTAAFFFFLAQEANVSLALCG